MESKKKKSISSPRQKTKKVTKSKITPRKISPPKESQIVTPFTFSMPTSKELGDIMFSTLSNVQFGKKSSPKKKSPSPPKVTTETKFIPFENDQLLELFDIYKNEYDLYSPFMTSRFDLTTKITNKSKMLDLLLNKNFLKDLNTLVYEYSKIAPDAKEKKIEIETMREKFLELKDKSTDEQIIDTLRGSELMGDLVLYLMVDEVVKQIEKRFVPKNKIYKRGECINVMINFLNSNVFLYNVLKKLTDLDLSKFFPKDFTYKRIGKRVDNSRDEITEIDCIDYKYYANLFEQLIAYKFIKNGFKKTFELFLLILEKSGFVAKDFFDSCINNKPYGGLLLKPGCSCKKRNSTTKKGERLCDNPEYYEPKYLINTPCPIDKCSPDDIEFITKSKISSQYRFIEDLTTNDVKDIFMELLLKPEKFFIEYVFNWRRVPYQIDNTYLNIFLRQILYSSKFKLEKPIQNYLKEIQNDIMVLQKEHDRLETLTSIQNEYKIKDLYFGKAENITYPEALAVVRKFPFYPNPELLEQNMRYLFKQLIQKYKNILSPPKALEPKEEPKKRSSPKNEESQSKRQKSIRK